MGSRTLEEDAPASGRRPLRAWVRKMAWLAVPLALAGEAGHHLLELLGQTLAHHFFHIVFGGGAVAAFAAYVIVDVRRYGRPIFSWRLRPGRGPEARR